jgi:hypothetical protein
VLSYRIDFIFVLGKDDSQGLLRFVSLRVHDGLREWLSYDDEDGNFAPTTVHLAGQYFIS